MHKSRLASLGKSTSTVKPAKSWGSGRGGRPWRRLRDSVLVRDSYTCQCCGLVTKQLELDHRIPVCAGGTDDEANLQALCVSCHKDKTQRESQGNY